MQALGSVVRTQEHGHHVWHCLRSGLSVWLPATATARAHVARRLAYPINVAAASLASPCGRRLHAGLGMAAATPCHAQSAASRVAARAHVRRAAPCLLITPPLSVALALRCSTYLPALLTPSGYCRVTTPCCSSHMAARKNTLLKPLWQHPSTNRRANCVASLPFLPERCLTLTGPDNAVTLFFTATVSPSSPRRLLGPIPCASE
jgi:hypothetical protein